MATSTISHTITGPTGTALSGVPIIIRLVPRGAFRTADGSEVAPVYTTTTNASGQWSATLERNSGISPANSYYEVEQQLTQAQGGPRKYNFQVGASNQSLFAALINVIPDLASANYLTQASADARYQQLTGYGVAGDLAESRPGDAASAGVLTTAARSDHKHDREQVSGTNAARLALSGTDLYSGLIFTTTDTNRVWLYEGSTWYLLPISNTPHCFAYREATQSVATATLTGISMTSEDVDTDSMHDNATNPNRILLPYVGRWLVNWAAVTASYSVGLAAGWINMNGTSGQRWGHAQLPSHGASSSFELSGSGVVTNTATTDWVQLTVYQDTGGNLNYGDAAGLKRTYLEAIYLGPVF